MSRYVNLFLGNGNIILLGGWKYIFIGGLVEVFGGMNTPGFASLNFIDIKMITITFSDMANILLLLVIFMFVFAVIGVSLFAATSPGYFGNLETGILL